MTMFLFNTLLAVTWGMATGMFTVPNLAFGFALGYLILRFSQRVLGPSPYFVKVPLVIRFVLRYLWDLVLANRATEPAGMQPEKRLFGFSVIYLFALFAGLVADRWIGA